MSRRRSPSRRPAASTAGRRAGRGTSAADALVGLVVVAAMLLGAYGGILLAALAAKASGAAGRTDAVAAPVFVGGVVFGGVGSLFLLLAVARAVRAGGAPRTVRDAPRPSGRGLRHDLRAAGRSLDDATTPTRDPQTRDRSRVVLLATACAVLAPVLALVLVTALVAALADVVPEGVLSVLSLLLSLAAIVVAGPVGYQLVSGRAVDEYPAGMRVPGISRLRRGGRPFPPRP